MSIFKPILFCFIGPGASGKSSICRALVESALPVVLSVSSTTRAPRGGEKEGQEYFFKSRTEFESDIKSGKFLEYAEFAGNLYGTALNNLDRAEQIKKHLILDIEINGVRSLRKFYGDRVVVTFVCPPTLSELRERFELRGGDSKERIEERMKIAEKEVREGLGGDLSDYLIVNEDLDQSIREAKAVVVAEQIRRKRVDFDPLVKG